MPRPRFRDALNSRATQVTVSSWTAPEYSQHVTRTFTFFRQNGDGRYSDATVMRLATAADEYSRRSGYEDSYLNDKLPLIATVSQPFEFDEMTEVKKGGIIGMMITWRDKSIIAVAASARRCHVGSVLMYETRAYTGMYPNMWVGQNNLSGHIFLLNSGLFPTAMNNRGAVRYSRGRGDEDE